MASMFWLSSLLGKKTRSSEGYFVAGGQIPWFVNGIALTGGYLSAASFLGICGMIAFQGFDGYLYSIGFLSGWVIALFVVAEPLRRLGKYTFADAIESAFESKSIHLAAGISTLVICMCYMIPQLVGAGVLIEPLLGIPYYWGVIIVGVVVIFFVASAGMSSTTYVQFINAGMLLLFSGILVLAICLRGLETTPDTVNQSGEITERYIFSFLPVDPEKSWEENLRETPYSFSGSVGAGVVEPGGGNARWVLLKEWVPLENDEPDSRSYHPLRRGKRLPEIRDPEGAISELTVGISAKDDNGGLDRHPGSAVVQGFQVAERNGVPHVLLEGWWRLEEFQDGSAQLREAQDITKARSGELFINGFPAGRGGALAPMGRIAGFGERSGHDGRPGPIGPLKLLSVFADPGTDVELPRRDDISYNGREITLYYHETVPGNELMRPGGFFDFSEKGPWGRLDFISLMVALFFGTAALPHVLIRYYTVKNYMAARRSTIVAITAIGLFYIMTLFLGLGAIANGVLNPQSDNMSAPLLALSFGNTLFAVVTALAFTTVLATVSGLIVAASGAVVNDLMDMAFKFRMDDRTKVLAAKATAVSVGIISMVLGILLRDVNVSFLVGLAFAVAASANFPAIIMVLFWSRTSSAGIVSSIFAGIIASLGILLTGPDMFALYGLSRAEAWSPLGQPAILAMPFSFLTLVVVSLLTPNGRAGRANGKSSQAVSQPVDF